MATPSKAVKRNRETIELQHACAERDVVVALVLISTGYPRAEQLPTDLHGRGIAWHGGGQVAHPALAACTVRRAREAVSG
ncbi:MAG: hypothetical protein OXO56_10510 [Gammaproteobacteria bacterium]|nr:hypothetical protein [Gammaproteobacteria bacterium]